MIKTDISSHYKRQSLEIALIYRVSNLTSFLKNAEIFILICYGESTFFEFFFY